MEEKITQGIIICGILLYLYILIDPFQNHPIRFPPFIIEPVGKDDFNNFINQVNEYQSNKWSFDTNSVGAGGGQIDDQSQDNNNNFNSNNNNNNNKYYNKNKNNNKNKDKKEKSNVNGLSEFTKFIKAAGFKETSRDMKSNKMFFTMTLQKDASINPADNLNFSAKPCIYKRR